MLPQFKTPILVTGTFTPSGTQDVNIVGPNPLPVDIAPITGTWKYYAGVVGTVIVLASERICGISAHSTIGGSMSINGGPSVPLPAGISVSINPNGNLVAPTITFVNTDTYFIETVI